MDIILNYPMLDYLTMSWAGGERGDEIAKNFHDMLISNEGIFLYDQRKISAKRMQYEGGIFSHNIQVGNSRIVGDEVGFFGKAVQGVRSFWYMVQVESQSNFFWNSSVRELFGGYPRFTRIDVQVTIEHEKIDFSHMAKHPNCVKWQKGESIYFNSRTNPRFYRIYNKPSDEGNNIRFEMELKDRGAMAYRGEMYNSAEPARDIYASEYDNMIARIHPELAEIANTHIKPLLTERESNPVRRKKTDHINWLTNQVRPALLKYVLMDDLRLPTVSLAYEIIQRYENQQKGENSDIVE